MKEKELNIYEKIQLCRVELQNKKLKKSGKNKFAGFEYFELRDFLPTINEIFKGQGLFSKFDIEEEKATLLITDGKNELTFKSPTADASLKGATPIQSLGAIHTYMKRYLYLNALEIVESDLLDSKAGSDAVEDDSKEIMLLVPKVMTLIIETDTDLEKVLETYKTDDLSNLSLKELKKLEKVMLERKEKQNIPTTQE